MANVRSTAPRWMAVSAALALGACADQTPTDGARTADRGPDATGGPDLSSDGASDGGTASATALAAEVRTAIRAASGGRGVESFVLPGSDDFDAIPQDPSNPLSAGKVALGQMLFHDTAFALGGRGDEAGSWSCATCHHADAGFKSGVKQGIGEGGIGFGANGSGRTLDHAFDGDAAADAANRPDIQPLTSPTVLNAAYQEVMLWNGQFGNRPGGPNAGVSADKLTTAGTPKAANEHGLGGLEIQAIAGTGVHRLRFDTDTELQTRPEYRALWDAAYPDGSSDVPLDAAKAIAAFERTVLATRAPFQDFLRGDDTAMDDEELRGAALFFGKAGCVGCHTGPALSSWPGATGDALFFAIGLDDFDTDDAGVHGSVGDADRRGRGGLTDVPGDDWRFKIPPLYNLADTNVFGHGASLASVREVVEYKNRAVPQNADATASLDVRFAPLALDDAEVDALSAFLIRSLHDPALDRYTPSRVPSGRCVTVDAFTPPPADHCR